MKCTDPHEVWLAWKKGNMLGNMTQNVLYFQTDAISVLVWEGKGLHSHTSTSFGNDNVTWCGCRLSWWASLGTNVKRHSSLSLDFSLSFPPVLQPTSSPLRCLSLFSFLFPPIILWVFCPFSLVFSTPPSFWVGEGHGLCLSYLNFHFPKECFRHAHLCTYTHANAYTLIQQAELLSCTHH